MEIMNAAVGAAREAGKYLKENLGKARHIERKGAIDLVTEMDHRAEEMIIERIKKQFPDHGILTEERAEEAGSSKFRWIIDPLDGTTNYAHGFPVFCVSMAFEEDGVVILGVIYDPMRDELFTVRKGGGAYLNGVPIRVSHASTLGDGLLATGFPYDIRTNARNNIAEFASFAVKARAIRRAGSAALDLAYVACGRFDGFWEMRLKPWDVAAGALMVKAAGGEVTDFRGGAFTVYSGDILASNGHIHGEMKGVLSGVKG